MPAFEFMFMVGAVVFLGITTAVTLIYALEQRAARRSAEDLRDNAINIADAALESQATSEKRQEEVSKIHQEMLGRPIQYVMPQGAVETIGNLLIQYLQQTERR